MGRPTASACSWARGPLQGAFGALLAPTALAVLTTTFTIPKERARAFGVFGAIAGAGGAIGLLLGGFLTQNFSWRWNLYINVVIAMVAIAGAIAFVHQAARTGPRPKLDIPGTVLVSGGLFGLVYGFSNAATNGWGSPLTWGMLAAAALLLVAFVLWQRRAAHPLLPLAIVLDRNRGAAYSSVLIAGVGMFAIFLFVTYYLQTSLNYTPIMTGLAFLPMIGTLILTAQLSTNFVVPRLGPKVIVPFGMTVGVTGMLFLTRLDLDSSYAANVLPALMLLGLAMGSIMPASIQTATLGVTASSPEWPQPWSTPASRWVARSGPRCSTRWPRPRPPTTSPRSTPPTEARGGGRRPQLRRRVLVWRRGVRLRRRALCDAVPSSRRRPVARDPTGGRARVGTRG